MVLVPVHSSQPLLTALPADGLKSVKIELASVAQKIVDAEALISHVEQEIVDVEGLRARFAAIKLKERSDEDKASIAELRKKEEQLRKKEEQLREEKGQLRKEKGQLLDLLLIRERAAGALTSEQMLALTKSHVYKQRLQQ